MYVCIFETVLCINSPYFCSRDCHGGANYLHEHLKTDYVSCWQQDLTNGEIDAAVCDVGTSRWFNYYLEGVQRSVQSPPHMDGIYYDGINFGRSGMQRVRKTIDRASANKQFAAKIDLHTGNIGAGGPPGVRYAAHAAYADKFWNGEGFQFKNDADYWLVEVSGLIHGIGADRLGGRDHIKGMVYATTERNNPSANELWKFWDQVEIAEHEMIGYWEKDAVVKVKPHYERHEYKPCEEDWTKTPGEYVVGAGGAADAIGVGWNCGEDKNRPYDYPDKTLAEVKALCCKLGNGCAAFDVPAHQNPHHKGIACMKKNMGGGVAKNGNYTGWRKNHYYYCHEDSLKATAYVRYQISTVVAVSSWCPNVTNATLSFDWDLLGLHEHNVSVTQPSIPGVQNYSYLVPKNGKVLVPLLPEDNGGKILVLTPKKMK